MRLPPPGPRSTGGSSSWPSRSPTSSSPGKAAATIWGRVRALYGAGPLDPAAVLATPEADLRAAGLSGRQDGRHPRPGRATSRRRRAPRAHAGPAADDEVVEQLVAVRGHRAVDGADVPDVHPAPPRRVAHRRLRRARPATAIAYGLSRAARRPRSSRCWASAFRPYRSVAAWYCWRRRGRRAARAARATVSREAVASRSSTADRPSTGSCRAARRSARGRRRRCRSSRASPPRGSRRRPRPRCGPRRCRPSCRPAASKRLAPGPTHSGCSMAAVLPISRQAVGLLAGEAQVALRRPRAAARRRWRRGRRPVERVVEAVEAAQVDRGDQAALVAEVVVDERPRHAGGLGDLLEGDLGRVAAGEHPLGRLEDLLAPDLGIEPGSGRWVHSRAPPSVRARGVVDGLGSASWALPARFSSDVEREVAGHVVARGRSGASWARPGRTCPAAFGQRVRNRQPLGGATGEGSSPPSVVVLAWAAPSGRAPGSS